MGRGPLRICGRRGPLRICGRRRPLHPGLGLLRFGEQTCGVCLSHPRDKARAGREDFSISSCYIRPGGLICDRKPGPLTGGPRPQHMLTGEQRAWRPRTPAAGRGGCWPLCASSACSQLLCLPCPQGLALLFLPHPVPFLTAAGPRLWVLRGSRENTGGPVEAAAPSGV